MNKKIDWHAVTEPRNARWKMRLMKLIKQLIRWNDGADEVLRIEYHSADRYSQLGTYDKVWFKIGALKTLFDKAMDTEEISDCLDLKETESGTTVSISFKRELYRWKM